MVELISNKKRLMEFYSSECIRLNMLRYQSNKIIISFSLAKARQFPRLKEQSQNQSIGNSLIVFLTCRTFPTVNFIIQCMMYDVFANKEENNDIKNIKRILKIFLNIAHS